jgi:Fur family transcriptional regulator, ferric uptake regulator
VVSALLETDSRHAWSLDELVDEVRSRTGSADYSTVFRFMALLENQGRVRRLELGDGKARYEVHQAHHEHITCVACGRISEVPGCLVDEAAERIRRNTGYRVTGHSLVFSGVCPECAST